MLQLRRLHAAVVNALGRIFGVGAIVVGVVLVVWGCYLLLNRNTTIDVNSVPGSDVWEKALVLIVGLVACVLGVLTLMARPYRGESGRDDDIG